jgi:serine/threonine protein kinase
MPDRRLKVTDFGIARAIAGIHPDEQNDVVWGSPLYFSPEQASGQAPSPSSDVYSLGVVMYEMLAGRPPFIAQTAETLAAMHREMYPKPASDLNPAITPELEQIMMKILAKEPSARYRTADQLGRVLMTFGQARKSPAVALSPELPPAITGPTVLVMPPEPEPVYEPVPENHAPLDDEELLEVDWISVGLGLLAVLAVGGLFVFWFFIYLRFTNPVL